MQVKCNRSGTAQMLPLTFQPFPSRTGFQLCELAIQTASQSRSAYPNGKEMAELACRWSRLRNELQNFSVALSLIVLHVLPQTRELPNALHGVQSECYEKAPSTSYNGPSDLNGVLFHPRLAVLESNIHDRWEDDTLFCFLREKEIRRAAKKLTRGIGQAYATRCSNRKTPSETGR